MNKLLIAVFFCLCLGGIGLSDAKLFKKHRASEEEIVKITAPEDVQTGVDFFSYGSSNDYSITKAALSAGGGTHSSIYLQMNGVWYQLQQWGVNVYGKGKQNTIRVQKKDPPGSAVQENVNVKVSALLDTLQSFDGSMYADDNNCTVICWNLVKVLGMNKGTAAPLLGGVVDASKMITDKGKAKAMFK